MKPGAKGFRTYRSTIEPVLASMLSAARPNEYDSAAFPSYTHANRLMAWLFWRRLRIVMRFVEKMPRRGSALDFGCGGGVMLPFLSDLFDRVVGYDMDTRPAEQVLDKLGLRDTVELAGAEQTSLDQLQGPFNLILALDVLEHIDDLEHVSEQLASILEPDGVAVISGPTETLAYKLGRKLAGFTGNHHHHNIYWVRDVLAKRFSLTTLATLYYPLPLFKIYLARKT